MKCRLQDGGHFSRPSVLMLWNQQPVTDHYAVGSTGLNFGKHYNDITMSVMTSQITGIPIVYLTICSGGHQRKHQAPRHWPLWGKSTGEFPSCRASNAGKVSYDGVIMVFGKVLFVPLRYTYVYLIYVPQLLNDCIHVCRWQWNIGWYPSYLFCHQDMFTIFFQMDST